MDHRDQNLLPEGLLNHWFMMEMIPCPGMALQSLVGRMIPCPHFGKSVVDLLPWNPVYWRGYRREASLEATSESEMLLCQTGYLSLLGNRQILLSRNVGCGLLRIFWAAGGSDIFGGGHDFCRKNHVQTFSDSENV